MLLVVIIICVNLPHSPQATCYGGSTKFSRASVAASYLSFLAIGDQRLLLRYGAKDSATT